MTKRSKAIVLIDAASDSLTISWPAVKGAAYYVLEFRTTIDDEFVLLSDRLSQPQARKNNLSSEYSYFFRVLEVFPNGENGDEWMTHQEPFCPLDAEEENWCMSKPVAEPTPNNTNGDTLLVTWDDVPDANAFELQMRENRGGAGWVTIVQETNDLEVEVKQKKQHVGTGLAYQFRVRPTSGEYEEPWSEPSDPVAPGPRSQRKKKKAVPKKKAKATPSNNGSFRAQKDPNEMAAPWIKNGGMKNAVLVCWQKVDGVVGYQLQMKENMSNKSWSTIAKKLTGTEVRKKNLFSTSGYQFRVRPVFDDYYDDTDIPYSQPSSIAIAT